MPANRALPRFVYHDRGEGCSVTIYNSAGSIVAEVYGITEDEVRENAVEVCSRLLHVLPPAEQRASRATTLRNTAYSVYSALISLEWESARLLEHMEDYGVRPNITQEQLERLILAQRTCPPPQRLITVDMFDFDEPELREYVEEHFNRYTGLNPEPLIVNVVSSWLDTDDALPWASSARTEWVVEAD